MLACARLGAVHSVVFGGFAPKELAARIDDARPTVLVAASCGIEPTRVVDYKEIQFSKTDEVLQAMGLDGLKKSDRALEELRAKGITT
jgi:acyl-coenzyme A synthetase/AMP-(fatty) acid ligase